MPVASGYGRSQIIQAIMSTLTMNFPVLTSILCKLYKFNSLATMLKKPLKKKGTWKYGNTNSTTSGFYSRNA